MLPTQLLVVLIVPVTMCMTMVQPMIVHKNVLKTRVDFYTHDIQILSGMEEVDLMPAHRRYCPTPGKELEVGNKVPGLKGIPR